MTNIVSISLILVGCSIIVAFIGLFFVFKICLVWKRLDKNLLKTMVFLDENFLVRNWVYLLATGAFIALRRVIQFLELLELPIQSPAETIIFDLMGLAVITLLVQLGYYWYRLIYSSLPPSK
ncbi:MAG: hypothetical protein LUQ20_09675 [Candidatus Methanoperedens sp.]|nr:hypothetical protein [Candidatus Methanoperedens sp.]